jgi:hypothetical protein
MLSQGVNRPTSLVNSRTRALLANPRPQSGMIPLIDSLPVQPRERHVAWGLLAAVTTVTTTTTTSATTTSTTTTTVAQIVGGQVGNSGWNVWVPLLSALLGAIIGGVLSVAGSVWVNRMEVSRTARLRIYDELLPKLRSDFHSFVEDSETRKEAVLDVEIRSLVQASLIAGRSEYHHATSIAEVWSQNRRVLREATRQDLFLLEEDTRRQIQVPANAATKEIRSCLDALQRVLEQRLERRFG